MSRSEGVEVESLAEFDRRLATGVSTLRGWHLQSLDLTGRDLSGLDVAGAVFLGCRFAPGAEEDVRSRGGLVFPAVPAVPFDPYRAGLYSPTELYDGLDRGYSATFDARVYAWSRAPRSLNRSLAAALHDHAIDDALDEYVAHRSLIGVMGGHAVKRGSAEYLAAATLGHRLAGTHTVATGGGPGAMEAANLGAWLAGEPESVLAEANEILAHAPDFHIDATAWARAADEVVQAWPDGGDSLGIPTWHYGHEPPNRFAGHIAKYFTNSIREDVLLRVCRGGIVFLPGSAGTVQEIFQTACEQYYAAPADRVPLVLVGTEHWTSRLPAWSLLETLLAEHPQVRLVDSVAEAAELLLAGR